MVDFINSKYVSDEVALRSRTNETDEVILRRDPRVSYGNADLGPLGVRRPVNAVDFDTFAVLDGLSNDQGRWIKLAARSK